MTGVDWIIVALYLGAMLLLAVHLGRDQSSKRDYYLGGNLPASALAISIIATQCSTNSLLGAPAFVGFVANGGLIWLQYELALPLAMLVLAFVFPVIYRSRTVSVYAFLEDRLGPEVRRLASACFLFFRGVATAVTVYGVASILALITGLDYLSAVLLLMGVTVIYDVVGGMRAVVISDVIQMLLLVSAVGVSLVLLWPELQSHWGALEHRTDPLDFHWGVAGSGDYGFWPMLFGGLFLYVAYYGCDQSQAQRLLASRNDKDLHRSLLINGLLRFPLVFAYCLLGIALAAYALSHPAFLTTLPLTSSGNPNLNLVFPTYVLREFAPGFAGLAIVGLFAAAMSSIDSALNSLSASSLEDFASDAFKEQRSDRELFRYSKLFTALWGLFAVVFSFSVEHIAATILEAINKIGSVANGPLLALFLMALLLPGIGGKKAMTAFFVGILVNLGLWLLAPEVSWLWWNVAGCLASLTAAVLFSLAGNFSRSVTGIYLPPRSLIACLTGAFFGILTALAYLHS